MCSIFGVIGTHRDFDNGLLAEVGKRSRDRGRDGTRVQLYRSRTHKIALGSSRAAPTTEKAVTEFQPYGGIVHNGTIANDRELGNPEGEVDSKVLPSVLERSSFGRFADSIRKLRGSYAIAAVSEDRSSVYLARNYKPIFVQRADGVTAFSSCARHLRGLFGTFSDPVEVPPYSCLDLMTGEAVALPRDQPWKALVIASSGLDSTTAAWMMRRDGWSVDLLHFRYGCRAEGREVDAIGRIADAIGGSAFFWDLPLSPVLGGNGGRLLDADSPIAGPIEGAEFAHEWVPARNFMFVGMATAFAEANGYGAIVLGNNLEEAGAYPDNEEAFTDACDAAMHYAVADGKRVRLVAPVARLMKHEIVREGIRLGVPYELTWSCYKGGDRPCRNCGPCFMREEAFRRNGAIDPLVFPGD